jgi:putative ATP-binding cassette transporter
MRIEENAESIAFYGGETLEERETRLRFNRTVDNRTQLNYAQTKLNFFTITYYHLVNILPLCILANEFFAGLIEYGIIYQVRDAFWHILNDFSVIIGQFNGIASFMASIDRLFLFMKKIQELDPSRPNEDASVLIAKESTDPQFFDSSGGIILKEYDALDGSSWPIPSRPILSIRNLRLKTPDDKRVLIRRLNLTLSMGQNLLIAGVSGAGKSSLLRAIAGLWKNGDGEITRTRDVYFLPQRP